MAKRHALVIGNSDYIEAGEFPRIEYAKNDAHSIFELLVDSPISVFSKRTSICRTNLTRDALDDVLACFFSKIKRTDLVLVYFAGHAKVVGGKMLFLAMTDTKPDMLARTAFHIDALLPYLEERQLSRYVVVLDCCRSGVALKSPGIRHRGIIDDLGGHLAGKGKIFVASALEYQLAHELEVLGHGLFSHYFIRGIKTGEAVERSKEYISITDLCAYILMQISLRHPNVVQEPVLAGTDQAGQLVVAKNPNYEPEDARIASTPATLEALLEDCKRQIDSEIAGVIGDKFIPSLYVDRSVRERISDFLSNRRELAWQQISFLFRLAHKHLEELQGQRERVKERLSDVDEDVSDDDFLELHNLTEGIEIALSLKPLLTELKKLVQEGVPQIQLIRRILKKIEVHRGCLSSMRSAIYRAQHYLRNCLIITDAAGRGKTNLACALALERVKMQPTILIAAGALFLHNKYSLEKYVQVSLGYSGQLPASRFLAHLARLAQSSNTEVLVILDAINENRNIHLIKAALHAFMARYNDLNFKFLVTCRDIYWHGFLYQEGDFWQQYAYMHLQLGEFTDSELAKALKLYFKRFQLEATLSEEAREKLKHPVLLRFFCEAYHARGTTVNLGLVQDIKLKPLFDVYWQRKVSSVKDRLEHREPREVERLLLSIAREMRLGKSQILTFSQVTRATGLKDFETKNSPYTLILDEGIILEQIPSRSGWKSPRISFVYEEFMEYAMARELTQNLVAITNDTKRRNTLLVVLKDVGQFSNVYGVLVYLLPMLEQTANYAAWDIVCSQGKEWHLALCQALLRGLPSELGECAFGVAEELARSGDLAVKQQIVEFSRSSSATMPERAIPILSIFMKDPIASVRLPARHTLVNLSRGGHKKAEQVLHDALTHSDWTVRGTAVYALAELRHITTEELYSLVEDNNVFVREAVIYALGRVRDRSDQKMLRESLKKALGDRTTAIRFIAAKVISKQEYRNLLTMKTLKGARNRERVQVIQEVLDDVLKFRHRQG
jgi:hypothetical protein